MPHSDPLKLMFSKLDQLEIQMMDLLVATFKKERD